MDSSLSSLPPGDPKLIDSIVSHLKCEGIFDEFRKACLADVDTKPAYQNLRTRVEGFADDFLKNTQWRPDLNKNQLRDGLRRRINESGLLTTGVDRIIDQIVNPKIVPFFLPKIVEIVYRLLGIVKQESPVVSSLYLPGELIPPVVSSAYVKVAETTKLPPPPAKTETVKDKVLTGSQKKMETKSAKSDGTKTRSPVASSKPKSHPTHPSPKLTDASKSSKTAAADELKSSAKKSLILDKHSGSPKIKVTESPKRDEALIKKQTESKSGAHASRVDEKESKKGVKSLGKDDMERSKSEKSKQIGSKLKVESREETKAKSAEKPKSLESKPKIVEKQKSLEGEKVKSANSSTSRDKSVPCKPLKNFEKALMSAEGEKISSSQSSKSPSAKDDRSSVKKARSEDRSKSQTPTGKEKSKLSSKNSHSRSSDHKKGSKEKSGAGSRSPHATKDKRKSEDEGSQEAKKSRAESSSAADAISYSPGINKEKSANIEDEGELSDVTVSSVHTSDLSDFDDHISLSDVEDDESGSQNKSPIKSPRNSKQLEEHVTETTEDKKAGLKISEDALMSSDELRMVSASDNQSEPKREMRRQRKVNPKYTSEDFSTIFSGNRDRQSHHSQRQSQQREDERKENMADVRLSNQSSSSIDRSELLGSPISDTPSEQDEPSKYGSSNLHSPILSSDDDLSICSPNESREESSPKISAPEPKTPQNKFQTRSVSSPEETLSPHQSQSHSSNDGGSASSKKPISRQRYDSSDLYKPRPVIVQSRRRGVNVSIERRDFLESEHPTTAGSDRVSPRRRSSFNDAGSPNQSKRSPNEQLEPASKRRRILHV